MSESLDKLRNLTNTLEDQIVLDIVEVPVDEYGTKIIVIETTKEALALIKSTQIRLAEVRDDSERKDERIKSLVAELKQVVSELRAANAEIDRINS